MKRKSIVAIWLAAAFAVTTATIAIAEAARPGGEPGVGKMKPDLNGRSKALESPSKRTNRLIREKSPYLLQHAHNPVDWYPWGEEAFEKAKKEDKPIFLSIGYSTCHWCHVMEHETFEDEDAARLMNETFVSIKVDREERPDIDHLYMTVCQMLTGRGGWPLNVILTPDKKPFFAGTYIPKETRLGRIGMLDLTRRIKELWAGRRDEVLGSAEKVTAALARTPDDSPGDAPSEKVLTAAYEQLVGRFEEEHGGFSQAPKFPTPHNLLFLLRYWKRTGEEKALTMVQKTLQAMRLGGIYDHLGFGFHRYSTDNEWLVPHFEKMLYDQALLAVTYLEAYQATGNEDYGTTARDVFAYVIRDMTSPEGGFYSAEDADSEGEEGKYYVWKLDEIREILGEEDARLVAGVLNVEPEGNFKEEATGRMTGANILHAGKSFSRIAADLGISEQALENRLRQARLKLFEAREKRIRPHKDDKILTDWNGLMIGAFARGAQVLERPEYAEVAKKAADFILDKMRTPAGRLLHRYRDGHAAIPACVDDYAFLVWGLLELYEATFDVHYLKIAMELNSDFLKYFWDAPKGGFFFTASDGEKLLVRGKEIYDGATPSGNSVAALNLLRLGRITANPDLERLAEAIGRAFARNIEQYPAVHTQFLVALEFGVGPSYEVVIAGAPQSEDTRAMLKNLRKPFLPNKVVILRPMGDDSGEILNIADYTRLQGSIDGKATAYVCLNFSCEFPTTDPGKMLELLDDKNP